jgi:hypothetical protein
MVLLPYSHGVFDDGLTADVSVFITQPLKDPPSRMTLLAVNLPIALEDLLNDGQKGIHDRRPWFRCLIPRRLRMTEDFFQSLPVNFILTTGGSLAQLAGQNATAHFHPDFHVGEHPRHLSPSDFSPGNPPS